MMCDSSYTNGGLLKPFLPDGNRGHWSKTSDFIFAGLGLSYRMDIFLLFIQLSDRISVTSLIPAFAISLALYTVPLLMVQSFMGQFSSSGFISAFRISPIFKGIGYVSLALNMLVLLFYSLFAMIPLVYLVGSFDPQLPWGCDGVYSWVEFCNKNSDGNVTESYLDFVEFFQVPSKSYFDSIFQKVNVFGLQFSLSWHLILSVICIWFILALIAYQCKNISRIGQIIRYSVCIVIALLFLLIARLSFIPGVGKVFSDIFTPNWSDFLDGLKSIPNYGISAFGPGWGLILTLASFNKFNTNIRYTSWLIGGGHMIMIILYIILELLIKGCVTLLAPDDFHSPSTPYLSLYLSGGSVFASMKWANLWSIVFYFMLFLAGVTLMLIQLKVILYSIFDEFVALRTKRTTVTLGLIGLMTLCSLYFGSQHGYRNFILLRFDTLITQTLIDLLVILAVLWVYGRKRFQRDLEFMINERFATWKIYVLRFLAPVVLLVALTESLLMLLYHSVFGEPSIAVFNAKLRPIPWLFVPGYAVYCLLKVKGTFSTRILKSVRPHNWYPVAAEHRENYEDVINQENMTHSLPNLEQEDNCAAPVLVRFTPITQNVQNNSV